MQKKQIPIMPIKMQRDLAVSQFPNDTAFEMKNMRILTNEENTALCITNEKGNTHSLGVVGTIIGVQKVSPYIVLFTTNTSNIIDINKDRIYILKHIDGKLSIVNKNGKETKDPIYKGNLGFDYKHPIESIGIVESSSLRKVYWVDGINYPRILRIAKDITITDSETQFDFNPEIYKDNEVPLEVKITPVYSGNGLFPAEVVQYVVTGNLLNGQESSVLYQSPLFYTSDNGRGLNPDGSQKSSISFNIEIKNAPQIYDYINVYRIERTSIDATPTISLIYQLSNKKFYSDTEEGGTFIQLNTKDIAVSYNSDIYEYSGKLVDILDNNIHIDYSNLLVSGYLDPPFKLKIKDKLNNTIYIFDSQLPEDESGLRTTTKILFKNSATFSNITIGDKTNNTSIILSTVQYTEGENPVVDGIAQPLLLTKRSNIAIVDSGNQGSIEDPSSLLYKGGDLFIANTLSHKDNTLFLGNILIKDQYLSNEEIEFIKNNTTVEFTLQYVNSSSSPTSIDTQYYYSSNLLKNSNEYTFYQCGETYRFGVQLLNKRGKWSEVIYIGDFKNDKRVQTNIYKECITYRPLPKIVIKGELPKSISDNYIAARPVCVFPTINDRSVLCQGLVCTTVYNVGDRQENNPYVQSSWFARTDNASAFSGINYPKITESTVDTIAKLYKKGVVPCNNMFEPSFLNTIGLVRNSINLTKSGEYRIPSVVYNQDYSLLVTRNSGDIIIDFGKGCKIKYGQSYIVVYDDYDYLLLGTSYWNENGENSIKLNLSNPDDIIYLQYYYAHIERSSSKINEVLLNSSFTLNSEIQGSRNYTISDSLADTKSRPFLLNRFRGEYGIERRIVTMHSPELDLAYDDSLFNIPLSNVKFRIVGFVQAKNSISNKIITIENPYSNISGVYNIDIIQDNSDTNYASGNSLISFPFFIDKAVPTVQGTYSFVVHPWNRKGSLINQNNVGIDQIKSGLKKNRLSNLKSCLTPVYFNIIEDVKDYYPIDVADIQLYKDDSNPIRLKAFGQSLNYYGEVSKILVYPPVENHWNHTIAVGRSTNSDVTLAWLNSINSMGFNNAYSLQLPSLTNESRSLGFNSPPTYIDDVNTITEPIPIEYKSTSHAVIAFDNYKLLPYMYYNYHDIYFGCTDFAIYLNDDEFNKYPTCSQFPILSNLLKRFVIEKPNVDNDFEKPAFYLMAELYRDEVYNRFGGTTEDALMNNNWVVCGEQSYFEDNQSCTMLGIYGDTLLGKYDNLKTYEYSDDSLNGVTEIVSFYCETRVNVDGRYDRNRGQVDNTKMSPTNFNLFNPVYSQRDNFFKSIYVNKDITNITDFPYSIVWSMTKTLGNIIDNWTSVSLSNILDLDGDKGSLNSLNRINNDIYALQDTGISKIMFNSRVQVSTSDSVPIEISNSGKVDGKIYISDNYGCTNKWSIVETPSGIYYMDDLNKDIYNFNGQSFINLTYTKHMHSWAYKKSSNNVWYPNANIHIGIRTLFDPINNDIYFTTPLIKDSLELQDEALAFNERIGEFTSLYSYGGVNWMFELDGIVYQVRDNSIWKLHSNDNYCSFFGSPKEYSLSIIANPEFQTDKIFDTLEFRTNGIETFNHWETDEYPFYAMETTNEYQKSRQIVSSLKKKFRNWRWQIGRDKNQKFKGDRIRNPWAMIKLLGNSNKEVKLYDIGVTYYV